MNYRFCMNQNPRWLQILKGLETKKMVWKEKERKRKEKKEKRKKKKKEKRKKKKKRSWWTKLPVPWEDSLARNFYVPPAERMESPLPLHQDFWVANRRHPKQKWLVFCGYQKKTKKKKKKITVFYHMLSCKYHLQNYFGTTSSHK